MDCASEPGVLAAGPGAVARPGSERTAPARGPPSAAARQGWRQASRGAAGVVADRSHRAVPYLRRQLRSLGRHVLGSVLAGLAVLVIGAPEQANAQTPNTAPTGVPTITGTAQVGQTLTAPRRAPSPTPTG